MITFTKRDDETPLCPYCKTQIAEVYYRELKGDLGKRCIYFCPKCKASLGVSQRKGLTMGL